MFLIIPIIMFLIILIIMLLLLIIMVLVMIININNMMKLWSTDTFFLPSWILLLTQVPESLLSHVFIFGQNNLPRVTSIYNKTSPMHLAQHNLVYKRSAFQTYCSEHPSAFAANNGVREPKCQNFGKNAENFARILKAVQYPFSSFIFVIIVIIIIVSIVIIFVIIIIRPGPACWSRFCSQLFFVVCTQLCKL